MLPREICRSRRVQLCEVENIEVSLAVTKKKKKKFSAEYTGAREKINTNYIHLGIKMFVEPDKRKIDWTRLTSAVINSYCTGIRVLASIALYCHCA